VAAVGALNVTVPGPLTLDHIDVKIPDGSPSSLTVPLSVTGDPNTRVCAKPVSTLGALLESEGVGVRVGVGVLVRVAVGVAVRVGVPVAVVVGVAVLVAVGVAVGVSVAVAVIVGVGVFVGVAVAVGVAVGG
jgi:hypothetical protein